MRDGYKLRYNKATHSTIETIIKENPKVFRPSLAPDGELNIAGIPGYEKGVKLDINPDATPWVDSNTQDHHIGV